jgi:hypothetical protein
MKIAYHPKRKTQVEKFGPMFHIENLPNNYSILFLVQPCGLHRKEKVMAKSMSKLYSQPIYASSRISLIPFEARVQSPIKKITSRDF